MAARPKEKIFIASLVCPASPSPPFDVLLTPSTGTPAPKDLTNTGNPMFQSPWTTCGFPAVTLPTGLSRSGLPVGLQLAAAPFAEERLLGAAHWCERVLDFRAAPPEPAQGATLT